MIEFKDLVGEIFLFLFFLGITFGVLIADKLRRKK
jgi:cbb3-type cytochrome oxidase subunit 3